MSDFSMHSSCLQAVNYNILMFSVISLLASWLKPVEESIEWKVSSPQRCAPVIQDNGQGEAPVCMWKNNTVDVISHRPRQAMKHRLICS